MPFIIPSSEPAPTVATTGLKIHGAVRTSVLNVDRSFVAGMQIDFAARLYDADTHEFMSIDKVAVNAQLPDGSAITLVEMTEEDEGFYIGSFVPDVHGEWGCELVYGIDSRVLDQKKFYVVNRQTS